MLKSFESYIKLQNNVHNLFNLGLELLKYPCVHECFFPYTRLLAIRPKLCTPLIISPIFLGRRKKGQHLNSYKQW